MTHFDPASALRQMREMPPTLIYPCFPPITMPLINSPDWAGTDLSQVRVWLNVAPVETLRLMQRALPHAAQIGSYGITEGGGIVSYNDAHETLEQLRADRRAAGAQRPRSASSTPTARTLPRRERRARSWSAAPGVMKGYYKDPERTARGARRRRLAAHR